MERRRNLEPTSLLRSCKLLAQGVHVELRRRMHDRPEEPPDSRKLSCRATLNLKRQASDLITWRMMERMTGAGSSDHLAYRPSSRVTNFDIPTEEFCLPK